MSAAIVALAANAAAQPPPDRQPPPEAPPPEKVEEKIPNIRVGGYLRPGFRFFVRPDAKPKDELDYGFIGEFGLEFEAQPFEMWKAHIEVELIPHHLEVIRDLELTDVDNDEAVDEISFIEQSLPGIDIPEASVAFLPHPVIALKAGMLRIPFTLQQQSANADTMFPDRSHPNERFLTGADLGALAEANVADGIFIPSLGVFNGASLGLLEETVATRGLVLAFRADVNPFGDFLHDGEGDPKRGPFRLGIGGGLLFAPLTIFDETTGTEPRQIYDLRFSGSLRMAVSGLYVAAEYFRRQQFDDFSLRPEVADGAYAQVGFFIALVEGLGLEPMVRAGFVAEDETFDPRLTGWIDGGLNFYPLAEAEEPDAVKLTLLYNGERRFTEREEAHGGTVTVLLKF